MDVKITHGNFDVLTTGVFIANKDTPIEFEINTLKIIIRFSNDEKNILTRVENEPTDSDQILKVNFINFNNPLGQGNTDPIQIGTLFNKKIYFNYRIYALAREVGKTLQFTFLHEK